MKPSPARLYSLACWAHGAASEAPQLWPTRLPVLEAVDVARFLLEHGQCGRIVGWFVDERGVLVSDEPRQFGPFASAKIAEWALEALQTLARTHVYPIDPSRLLEAASSGGGPPTNPAPAPASPPKAAAPPLPARDSSSPPAPSSLERVAFGLIAPKPPERAP